MKSVAIQHDIDIKQRWVNEKAAAQACQDG